MAAVRCKFSPDEELRMVSETRVSSTECFSLDRKSSCSISLIRLWLRESYISTMECQEHGIADSAVKGENSSCTILFLSSLDRISLKAISQRPVRPT